MRRHHTHLTLEDREQIFLLKVRGYSLRAIARELGKDHSTIVRELKRHRFRGLPSHYHPYRAWDEALRKKRRAARRPLLKHPLIQDYATEKLKEGWSPEQIAGRLGQDHPGCSISHETIYHWIYCKAKTLIPFLARRHKRRRKKSSPRRPRSLPIPYRIGLEARPEEANKRLELGHWEADSMVSRASRTAFHVLVERKTRLVKITRIPANNSMWVREAILARLGPQPPEARRSITYDNGPENHEHYFVNEALETHSFFCAPYHSWEKGTVENTIGLVRRFVPKKSNLQLISSWDLKHLENLLNNRPRKCLNFKTPREVYLASLGGAFPP